MTNDPVIVAVFDEPMSAHVARAHLELEGIPARLLDEHLLTVHPLLSRAVGGVKLVVAKAHAEAARAVLTRPAAPHDEVACPSCGSLRTEKRQAGRRSAFLTLLLLGVPIGRARTKLECAACGHIWPE